jgi:hypothetical protein
MAQDFYDAFQLGDTDKAYDAIDAHGVAFARSSAHSRGGGSHLRREPSGHAGAGRFNDQVTLWHSATPEIHLGGH